LGDWKHLSYASSLCGNCTEVCPVRINLHELLLENRAEAVEQNSTTLAEKTAWKFWKMAMLRRGSMNIANGKLKSWVVNRFVKDWKKGRSEIQFPQKSFNQLWKEKNKQRD
jgi:L-lactate dehydrogenase complex protein LldF